jgi:hypothetical protein
MAQLYLPVAHTEADLVLAGQIAERIDSGRLYVAWTPGNGRAVPEVVAELRAAVPHWTESLPLLVRAARELWSVLLGRDRHGAGLASSPRGTGELPAQPKPAA